MDYTLVVSLLVVKEKSRSCLSGGATVRGREIGTGISETSKRVPSFPSATQGGKQVSSYFPQGNWVQAHEVRTSSVPAHSRLT